MQPTLIVLPIIICAVAFSMTTETNEKLIATMDDVLRIQREGHEKRVAAEAQMAKIESELRKKLVDVTGLGGSAAK